MYNTNHVFSIFALCRSPIEGVIERFSNRRETGFPDGNSVTQPSGAARYSHRKNRGFRCFGKVICERAGGTMGIADVISFYIL
jgi:hypothetical protein